MNNRYIPIPLRIERETEKAYYVQIKDGECHNTMRFAWIPKSACKTQEYIATYNALNQPETYGKRVIKVAEWWAHKNKIF